MKIRIVESHLSLEQSDENNAAAVGHQLEGAHHRPGIPGCIQDHARQITTSTGIPELRFERLGISNQCGRWHTQRFPAEGEPACRDIRHRDSSRSSHQELDHAHPDGAGSDHKGKFIFVDCGTIDRMTPDTEHLDQRELFSRKRARGMEFSLGHRDRRTHAAVAVDSHHLQTFAAVRPAAPRGRAGRVIEVRFHRHDLPDPVIATGRDREDFSPDFVAENSGIVEEGLPPEKRVNVGTAHPDVADPDQGLPFRRFRNGSGDRFESARFDENDLGLKVCHGVGNGRRFEP